MKTFIRHFPLHTYYLKPAVFCEAKRKVPRYSCTFVSRASCCLSHQRGSSTRGAQTFWKHRCNSKHNTVLYIAQGCKISLSPPLKLRSLLFTISLSEIPVSRVFIAAPCSRTPVRQTVRECCAKISFKDIRPL